MRMGKKCTVVFVLKQNVQFEMYSLKCTVVVFLKRKEMYRKLVKTFFLNERYVQKTSENEKNEKKCTES